MGSAYTFNPEGLTNVLKQETILHYLKFVLEKNREVVNSYPKEKANDAWKAINRHVKKLELSVDERKGHPSIAKTLQFLVAYPNEIRDWRFALSAMFGNQLLIKMSRLKRRFRLS